MNSTNRPCKTCGKSRPVTSTGECLICRGTPTPDDIKAACREIQATWGPLERRRRNCYPTPAVELKPVSPVRSDDE